MQFERPTSEQALVALRGIKTVATADGAEPLSDFHRQFVAANPVAPSATGELNLEGCVRVTDGVDFRD